MVTTTVAGSLIPKKAGFGFLEGILVLTQEGSPTGHRCARGGYPGLDGNTQVQHGQPGSSNGSAPQRSRGPRRNTTDIKYIYMRNRSDRGLS